MLRARVDDDDAAGWSLTVAAPDSVDAQKYLHSVDALSDEAIVAARLSLNPADGAMLSAVWAASTRQLVLIVHHLAVDGVSWRILLEDLNIAWAQHHNGQGIALPVGGTSFARWSSLLAEHAQSTAATELAATWRKVAAVPLHCRPYNPRSIHTPTRETCRSRWTTRQHACCSVRCRQRSMPACKISC